MNKKHTEHRLIKNKNLLFICCAWGNMIGFAFFFSGMYEAKIFSYFSFPLLLSFPGIYASIIESKLAPDKLSIGLFLENAWFIGLISFFFGLPGIALGLAFK